MFSSWWACKRVGGLLFYKIFEVGLEVFHMLIARPSNYDFNFTDAGFIMGVGMSSQYGVEVGSRCQHRLGVAEAWWCC